MQFLSKFASALAAVCFSVAVFVIGPVRPAYAAQGFHDFIEALWPEAQSEGVSRKTFDAAFAGVEPDLTIPDLDIPGRPKVDNSGQAEFTKTAADYLSKPYLEKLAVQGRTFLAEHK